MKILLYWYIILFVPPKILNGAAIPAPYSSLTSLPTVDINPLLEAFSNCLLHLTNYEFLVITSNLSDNISKQYIEDILPFNYPIIINKHTSNNIEWPHPDWEKFQNLSTSTQTFLFPPVVHNMPCVVQIYLLKKVSNLPANFEWNLDWVRSDHSNIIFPKIKDFEDQWYPDAFGGQMLLKQGRSYRGDWGDIVPPDFLCPPRFAMLKYVWGDIFLKNCIECPP